MMKMKSAWVASIPLAWWIMVILGAMVMLATVRVAYANWMRRAPSERTRLQASSRSAVVAMSSGKHIPYNTMVVLGSGGHTAEMMSLLERADRSLYCPIVYVLARSDSTSAVRVQRFEERKNNADNFVFHRIPRSREVHQSWLTTPFTTLWACLYCMLSILNFRPDVIICNGPGTCIPMCFAALIMQGIGVHSSKIVFVESFCRVTSLSMTGRLLYPVASRFVVQWPQLTTKYARAEYIGRLC